MFLKNKYITIAFVYLVTQLIYYYLVFHNETLNLCQCFCYIDLILIYNI